MRAVRNPGTVTLARDFKTPGAWEKCGGWLFGRENARMAQDLRFEHAREGKIVNTSRRSHRLFLAGTLLLVLTILACATTRQTRSEANQSGFLGDYSQLREGGDDEAKLLYIAEDVDWAQYNAILLDSVTLWLGDESSKVSEEDQQMLTDYLYASLREQLSQDYTIVDQPGPGVLRVRAAITEEKGAHAVANAITTIVPQLKILATVTGMATDCAVLVAKAGVEVDVRDAQTDRRVAAAVDQRVGTKTIRGGLGTWSGVKEAFDYWAERLNERLEELRSGENAS